MQSGGMKYFGYEEVSTTVKINRSEATLIFRPLLDAQIWGTRHRWRLQQAINLGKRGGKWMILRSIAGAF